MLARQFALVGIAISLLTGCSAQPPDIGRGASSNYAFNERVQQRFPVGLKVFRARGPGRSCGVGIREKSATSRRDMERFVCRCCCAALLGALVVGRARSLRER